MRFCLKTPRPSRHLQMCMLQNIETRFHDIVQIPSQKGNIRIHLQLIRTLLMDVRHLVMYQNLDQDIRKNLVCHVSDILAYFQAWVKGIYYVNRQR